MKINELKDKWAKAYATGNNHILIAHNNNKTVKFWPTGLSEDELYYNLNGYWIINQTGEPIVQEEIHIKKPDLDNWNIVEE